MLIPSVFLTLLFISAVSAIELSNNDPFRTFSLQASRYPKFPICCLKPLSPHDPVEDHVLLSFEEWKAKQRELNELKEQKAKEQVTGHSHTAVINSSGHDTVAISNDSQSKDGESTAPTQILSSRDSSSQPIFVYDSSSKSHQPHFRAPLTDRFNYASIDCSARVHTAHRSAKSPSAVLDSKRDRYMLSPCKQVNGEKHFIAVELCDDIRIDTVQLANYEFFSGVFKDFSVRVAKTYITGEEGWIDAGTYRAKNVRGVQSFHPPTSLRDFYRFIRIEFHSYYGNEYYCPVSLLRVYGLTHLEEYKWEQWEEESRAKLDNLGIVPGNEEHPSVTPLTAAEPSKKATSFFVSSTSAAPSSQDPIASGSPSNGDSTSPSIISATHSISPDGHNPLPAMTSQNETPQTSLNIDLDMAVDTQTALPMKTDASLLQCTSTTIDSHVSIDTLSPDSSPHPTVHGSRTPSASLQHSPHTFSTSSSTHLSNYHHSVYTTSTVVVVPTAAPSMPHGSPAASPSTSGESIYRMIINRLAALELNHTLYARYIEQQNTAVRDVLKRLSEDVGRLEGIGRAHAQAHQRSIQEWNRQRQQLQVEYRELLAVVEYLSDEILLEKRLGLAQLCLLLLVLFFIALTRGSRGEAVVKHSMLAGAPTEGEAPIVGGSHNPDHSMSIDLKPGLDKFTFPQQKRPFSPVNLNVVASPKAPPAHRQPELRLRKLSDRDRSRTPSFRRKRNTPHPLHLSPNTPYPRNSTPSKPSARRILLHRSNSHSSVVHEISGSWSARSAKRSAKSAHLHEVIRTAPIRRDPESARNQPPLAREDVFGSALPFRRSSAALEVELRLPANHRRDEGSRGKRDRIPPDSQINEQRDELVVDSVNSDGDQWEDADSATDPFDF